MTEDEFKDRMKELGWPNEIIDEDIKLHNKAACGGNKYSL